MAEESPAIGSEKIIIFVVCSVVFYYLTRNSEMVSIKQGLFWPCIFAGAFMLGQTIVWWSRYKMPKLVLNGFNGSIWGDPQPILDRKNQKWLLFNTGEYKEPIHGRGKLASVIVPASQVKKVGMNYIGSTLVKKTPFRVLPSAIFDELRAYGELFSKEVVYFGYVDEYFIHENPKFKDLQAEIEAQNSRINSQRLQIEGKDDEFIEKLELHKKFSQPTILQSIFRRSPTADQGTQPQ